MDTDVDVNAAYLLFRIKGWKPKKYYRMGAGERLVTRAFLYKELEDREKELEEMKP